MLVREGVPTRIQKIRDVHELAFDAMAERRDENRENVRVYMRSAEDSLTTRGLDEEPSFQDQLISESYDWRLAFVHVGGAISSAPLDLADAVRTRN